MAVTLQLRALPGDYAVCKLDPAVAVPDWADGFGFVSVSRTPAELSIVCRAERVPEDVHAVRDWRCLEFIGPFAFDETGIAAAVLQPLAAAGIGILLISTFATDYLLVRAKDFETAKTALLRASHTLSD
jgi:hypothetical protein